ncbi:calcium-binding protein [Algicola sagamiensis]|uniref:calcium-binding protein n=1 Tax=Algicola sagamiensis TaxID=163869 RepID=UPI0012F89003|nr:calcium-binding protein [Algicola sagamiensis]
MMQEKENSDHIAEEEYVEPTSETKSKNIKLIVVGIVFGILFIVGALFFVLQTKNAKLPQITAELGPAALYIEIEKPKKKKKNKKRNEREDKAYTFFDVDSSGFAERTTWLKKNEGLIALDRNQNGAIDNGEELFSNETRLANQLKAPDGLAALRDLDKNQDGLLDSEDPDFDRLRIWQDKNHNGRNDPKEVFTLTSLGIDRVEFLVDKPSALIYREGKKKPIFPLVFERQPKKSMSLDELHDRKLKVSKAVKSLPDIGSQGNVHSFHQAIMKDKSGKLYKLAKQFNQEKRYQRQQSILDKMMYRWANTDEYLQNYPLEKKTQWLNTLLAFEGRPFVEGHIPEEDQKIFKLQYRELKARIYSQLVWQDQLKRYSELVRTTKNTGYGNHLTLSLLVKQFIQEINAQPREAKDLYRRLHDMLWGYDPNHQLYISRFRSELLELLLKSDLQENQIRFILKSIGEPVGTRKRDRLKGNERPNIIFAFGGHDIVHGGDGDDTIVGVTGNDKLYGEDGKDRLYGDQGHDELTGGMGDDTIYGGSGNDNLYGNGGLDTLIAGAGNDILDSGPGNDYMNGGLGDDTYVYQSGDGIDTIHAEGNKKSHQDKLVFGAGISPKDISYRQDGMTMVIQFKESKSNISIQDWYKSDHFKLKSVEFADGTKHTRLDIEAMSQEK